MSKLLVTFLLFALGQGLNSQPWKLVKEADQISVYSSKSLTGFDAIWIKAEVNCSLTEFVDFINNADAYQKWVYNCSYSKKIDKVGNVLHYETLTDMPFPVSDRYLKVKSTQELQEQCWISHSVAVPGCDLQDAVTINNFDSRWKVTVISPQKIHINYVIETEPGGYIPPWMYNLAVDIGPYNTMKNLKASLEKNNQLTN